MVRKSPGDVLANNVLGHFVRDRDRGLVRFDLDVKITAVMVHDDLRGGVGCFDCDFPCAVEVWHGVIHLVFPWLKAAYDSRASRPHAVVEAMRTHRIYIPGSLKAGQDIVLEGKPAHYLSRVLRLTENTEVILFNGDGFDYRATLVAFRRDEVRARVAEQMPNLSASPLVITLTQAMSRGDRMDYSLQKATELGVDSVQLLNSERVELKLSGKRLEKRMTHWQAVIQSACEQCGRATVPELHSPLSVAQWIEKPGKKLVLDASGTNALSQLELKAEIDIAVGPEGGFADSEIEFMKAGGVQAVQMGPRILRTETAGPAAIAIMQAMAGDL